MSSKEELGPILSTIPSKESSRWVAYIFLVLGLIDLAEEIWARAKNRPTSLGDLGEAVVWLSLGVWYLRGAGGAKVHQGGIDFGTLVFPWREIKGWTWSVDHTKLEFWTDSRWKLLLDLRPSRPITYAADSSVETEKVLDSLLPRYAGEELK